MLINHSHRVFFWANEFGRQADQPYDAELLFICAAFHDLGLLKTFRSADDRFEVDSANAVRQFLEHHGVPHTRIQTAWDAISLHTTPGIAPYKPIEVELLYNGVGLDVLGIGYEGLDPKLRDKVVAQFPRVDFHRQIAQAFQDGFGYKPQTTEGTCNEDICSHFIRNYKRSNFYEQIQNTAFPKLVGWWNPPVSEARQEAPGAWKSNMQPAWHFRTAKLNQRIDATARQFSVGSRGG